MKLVIAEKPSVGKNIASVIGAKTRQDGYYEGNGYIVTWCRGHLVGLVAPESYDARLEQWRFDTLPIIPERNNWKLTTYSDTKALLNVIKTLANRADVDELICATDVGQCVGVTKQIQSKKGLPHSPPKAMTVTVIVFFLAVIDGQN